MIGIYISSTEISTMNSKKQVNYQCTSPYGGFTILYSMGECEILFNDYTFFDKEECKELLKLKGEPLPEDVFFLKKIFGGRISIENEAKN